MRCRRRRPRRVERRRSDERYVVVGVVVVAAATSAVSIADRTQLLHEVTNVAAQLEGPAAAGRDILTLDAAAPAVAGLVAVAGAEEVRVGRPRWKFHVPTVLWTTGILQGLVGAAVEPEDVAKGYGDGAEAETGR